MSRNYGGDIETKAYIATFLVLLSIGAVSCAAKLKGNRDNIDTEKSFNFMIDYNGKGTSLTIMSRYSDYSGQTVEFTTQDGLKVLAGLNNAEIMYAHTYKEAYARALELAGGNPDDITSYDAMQGLSVYVNGEKTWNRKFINLNYDFDYAITETDNGVIITNISTWRDWDDDDKVQFVDADGNVYLTTYTRAKLLNSENADEQAVYQYALSLAGSEDRLFGDIDKENHKALRLVRQTPVSDDQE